MLFVVGSELFFDFGIVCFRLNVLLWLLLVKIAFNGIEDAVDELSGFVSGETACDLKRFVDRNGAGRRLV